MILMVIILVIFSEADTVSSEIENNELKECILLTHCVMVNWQVIDPESSLKK